MNNKTISIVLEKQDNILISKLKDLDFISEIYSLDQIVDLHKNTNYANSDFDNSTILKYISSNLNSESVLLIKNKSKIEININSFVEVFDNYKISDSGFLYFDHFYKKDNIEQKIPVLTAHCGSVRDDFNTGNILFLNSKLFKDACSELNVQLNYSGLYYLFLYFLRLDKIERGENSFYTIIESDNRKSGEKIFDYVKDEFRRNQIEKEEVFTSHLKLIDAFVSPPKTELHQVEENFEFEASVIIPVRNRQRTIADAIKSALNQRTDFPFNIIIVDNHSTDSTTDIIDELKSISNKLIHLIPEEEDLQIGGCWNLAINSEFCGKYAIQLDSDDLYLDENTLQKIVNKFKEENTAMLVGSYQLVDFSLNELAPGLIDHKEWTFENGRNNALRINGLGAPRAFRTDILRKNLFPNVSYGEDYAVGLAISRQYNISRIYDSLYLCRRWEGNSDSDISIEQTNKNNEYKDSLRKTEIEIRAKSKINS
ncbi:MAG: glycosyltransferase [Marinifilaceae bacterium]|jgi:hypothetical protein|nr:glycosyltransferase [Marinifilaceae bacterium]